MRDIVKDKEILRNLISLIRENNIQHLFIDLFAGAGGVSEGIHRTGKALSFYAVNHDPLAIQSHEANHSYAFHADEDIKTFDLTHLVSVVRMLKRLFPNVRISLWASLECTNFSKAKGGMARDADSRTLAEHLYRYVEALLEWLDMIWIENVVEFMSWGPLDENGKPVSKKNGIDFLKWKEHIESYGYRCDHKELNSADFGAHTSRIRLFMQYAKPHIEIVWPKQTHVKKAKMEKANAQTTENSLFQKVQLKQWKPVKDVLDFADVGKTIFNRKKDLSEKTLQRIYAGLIKYIAGGKDAFMAKTYAVASNSHGTYDLDEPAHTLTTRSAHQIVKTEFIMQNYSGNPMGKVTDVDSPARTITATAGNMNLVQPQFLMKYYSNGGQQNSVNDPAGTISTKDRFVYVNTDWLDKNYSGKSNHQSVDVPAGTLSCKDHYALMRVQYFINRPFSGGGVHSSIEDPAGSITSIPKMNLIEVEPAPFIMNGNFNNAPRSMDDPAPTLVASRRHHYLVNPQWGISQGGDMENPCFTLIARMDKTPPYLVDVEGSEQECIVNVEKFLNGEDYQYISDNVNHVYGPMVKKSIRIEIIEFMAMYGIIDIKMRMLKVPELKLIQGFQSDYVLLGNQTDQKKFIGNSVPPDLVLAMIEANCDAMKTAA